MKLNNNEKKLNYESFLFFLQKIKSFSNIFFLKEKVVKWWKNEKNCENIEH